MRSTTRRVSYPWSARGGRTTGASRFSSTAVEREEIDVKIAELEKRLERLRSLYEQYFLGIERIEPGVARKEVERRVAALRKCRFHSTAQRFKFQTIVQRYNTMQQYWNRICREIENGTYRRHKLKAERAFAVEQQLAEEATQQEKNNSQRAESARETAEKDLRQLLDEDLDTDEAMKDALRELEQPVPSASHASPPEEKNAIKQPTPPSQQGRAGGGLLSKLKQTSPPHEVSSISRGLTATSPPQLRVKSTRPTSHSIGAQKTKPTGDSPTKTKPTGGSTTNATGDTTTTAKKEPVSPPRTEVRKQAAQPPQAARPPTSRQRAPERHRLPEQRVRELHKAYVEARAKTNAKTVSFEKLERSLRETEEKLRRSHKGKNVDFDVVVKNGKAILKPKLF